MCRGFGFIGMIVGTQFIVSLSAMADTTYVSGIIDTNTVWDITGSPYIVIGDVTVDTLVTLDIETGVEVKLDSAKYIMIKGTLNAIGTATDSIIISALDTTKRWSRLWFKPASVCTLKYCRVEYAGNSAIYGDSASSLSISYNTIFNNNTPNSGGGIYTSDSANIINNIISNNSVHLSNAPPPPGEGGGIYSSGVVNIANNIISNNVIYIEVAGCYCGVGVGGGIYSSNSATISNNTISNNYILVWGSDCGAACGGGIYTSHLAKISNNTVLNNKVKAMGRLAGKTYGGGIFASDSAKIVNNTILNNSSRGSTYWGSDYDYGGGIYSCDSVGRISNNTISYNSSRCAGAIYIKGGFWPVVRHNTIVDSTVFALYIENKSALIYSSNLYSTGYVVYNASVSSINARYNYWYTTDTSYINAKIWDYYDSSGVGIVEYEPVLASGDATAPVAPPLNLVVSQTGLGKITMSWDSVPVFDLSGYKVWYDTDTSGYPYEGTGANEGNSPIDVGNATTFDLTGLTLGDTFYLAVTAYDLGGDSSWYSNEVAVTIVGVKESAKCKLQNAKLEVYPNPSFGNTIIRYGLPEKANISLELYDISGRSMKTIYSGVQGVGYHEEKLNIKIQNDKVKCKIFKFKCEIRG